MLMNMLSPIRMVQIRWWNYLERYYEEGLKSSKNNQSLSSTCLNFFCSGMYFGLYRNEKPTLARRWNPEFKLLLSRIDGNNASKPVKQAVEAFVVLGYDMGAEARLDTSPHALLRADLKNAARYLAGRLGCPEHAEQALEYFRAPAYSAGNGSGKRTGW